MKNLQSTFFFQVFASLSKTEVRQLQKLVASPYFNGRPQLAPLLDYFVETKAQGSAPEPELGFAAAFPGQPFNDQTWRLALSQLFKLAETMLALQTLETEPDYPLLPLCRAYRRRGLEPHFWRSLKKLDKQQAATERRPARFFEKKYQSEWEQYQMLSTGRRTENFNLQAVSDAMDAAFVARKLRLACFSLSHQAVYKTEYRVGLLDGVLTAVATTPALLNQPAIGLYFHCYQALTAQSEGAFEQFQKQLVAQGPQLPPAEQRNLYLLAINFGIRQINAGQAEYDRPVLELYRTALGRGLLLENGQLSPFAFANITAIAVRIGEVDWAEKFIPQHRPLLPRKHRNPVASLALARLEYTRKNYREALLHLQKADYKDFINNLIVKTLQLKIYFETDELEVLEAHLRNMKNYIRRQRAFGYHRENYLNIIRFTQAVVELNPFDKKQREKLRQEILAAEPLTERNWLLARLHH